MSGAFAPRLHATDNIQSYKALYRSSTKHQASQLAALLFSCYGEGFLTELVSATFSALLHVRLVNR